MIPATDYALGFDGYDATVEADPDSLVHVLGTELQATVETVGQRGRWTQGWILHRGPGPALASVHYTSQRPDEPFVECKSHADEIVPLLRSRYAHRVARVDVRLDFLDELYWCVLEPMIQQHAAATGTELEPRGPGHLDPSKGGRTWYLGKKAAMRRAVIYEKGCELGLATRGPIRLEVRVRPPSKLKAHYASLSAAEILLDNPFARSTVRKLGVDLGAASRVKPDPRRSDLDRALDTLARQYLRTLRLAAERFDSMADLVSDLEARIELDRTVRAALHAPSSWPHQDQEQRQ